MKNNFKLTTKGKALVFNGKASDGWLEGTIKAEHDADTDTMNVEIVDKNKEAIAEVSVPGNKIYLNDLEFRASISAGDNIKKGTNPKPFWVLWSAEKDLPKDEYDSPEEAASAGRELLKEFPGIKMYVLCSLENQYLQ